MERFELLRRRSLLLESIPCCRSYPHPLLLLLAKQTHEIPTKPRTLLTGGYLQWFYINKFFSPKTIRVLHEIPQNCPSILQYLVAKHIHLLVVDAGFRPTHRIVKQCSIPAKPAQPWIETEEETFATKELHWAKEITRSMQTKEPRDCKTEKTVPVHRMSSGVWKQTS